ncbi:MAG: tetratricopeptide repeat protein [Candidatus Thiodiazotropha sp.]
MNPMGAASNRQSKASSYPKNKLDPRIAGAAGLSALGCTNPALTIFCQRVEKLISIALITHLLLLCDVTVADAERYVGASVCIECHQSEGRAWKGSHHDLAMAEATVETVLGNFDDAEYTAHGVTSRFYRKDGLFFVRTDGPDGELHDYPIRYTFGRYPLQQYLIEFPRGHVQSLGLAWDSRSLEDGGQRWFHLYPNEPMDATHPLHWTARDQTWNYQCAECHSTGLRKNYDLTTDSYQTNFTEINVACEACHGPGSAHVDRARKDVPGSAKSGDDNMGLVVNLADSDGGTWVIDAETRKPRRTKPRNNANLVEMCARCHSRRGQIWADYEYGKPLGNTHRLALLDEQLYFFDGQIKDEVYVYGSFIQSRMFQQGVICTDCHEPHNLQLRNEGNTLCSTCHLPGRYDTREHHHHEPNTAGADCTSCHMPQRTYMEVDERADHSLRVPRPDLSVTLGTPNACNGCHLDKKAEWAAEIVASWFPESPYRGPHFGETLHAASIGAPDAAKDLMALAANHSQPAIVRASALERFPEDSVAQQMFTIQRLLADSEPLVRRAAVRLLAATDLRTQIDKGWSLLNDPDRSVRLETTQMMAHLLGRPLPEEYRQGLRQAIKQYLLSQQVNFDRPEAHLNQGNIARAIGDRREAEKAYRTALELDPSFVPGYVNLSEIFREQDKDNQGETILRAGIEVAPENEHLLHALGLLLVRNKQLEASLPYLRQAAENAEDHPHYSYVYALALQNSGDTPKALDVLGKVNSQNPGNREILIALTSLNREDGSLEQAKYYAGELVKRFPRDTQVLKIYQDLLNIK